MGSLSFVLAITAILVMLGVTNSPGLAMASRGRRDVHGERGEWGARRATTANLVRVVNDPRINTTPNENVIIAITDSPSGEIANDTVSPSRSPSSTSPSLSPTQSPATSQPSRSPSQSPTRHPSSSSPLTSPTKSPTHSPTSAPSESPSAHPSRSPSPSPSTSPSTSPTRRPSQLPTVNPTRSPTYVPTRSPTTSAPSQSPSSSPTRVPTASPTFRPSEAPSRSPTWHPTKLPSSLPTFWPSHSPSSAPSRSPTRQPSRSPSRSPTEIPTASPTDHPTTSPTSMPTDSPTSSPTTAPSRNPTHQPTMRPSHFPTIKPTASPTYHPTTSPTSKPTHSPTRSPTSTPSCNPTHQPSNSSPSHFPTVKPTTSPSHKPTTASISPTSSPTKVPSSLSPTSTTHPSRAPTLSASPTLTPTLAPTRAPTSHPTAPTARPTTGAPTTPAPTRSNPIPPKTANVLFLIADDFKPLSTSYNIDPSLFGRRSTNLERLAKLGTQFMNAHAQMSLCGPSRASFLTSRRPSSLGILNLQKNALGSKIKRLWSAARIKLMTIPRMFKENGYQTYGFGKISHENEVSFMKDPNTWTEPVFTWLKHYVRPPTFTNPYQGNWIDWEDVPDTAYSDGQAAQMAASYITRITTPKVYKPFAIFLGLWKPHLPWRAPAKYFLRNVNISYPAAHHAAVPPGMTVSQYTVVRGDGCKETAPYNPPFTKLAGWTTTDAQQRQAVRAYFATADYMEEQLGVVLEALFASPAANNTHIVFIGDHGFHLGDHGLYCKHTNFEQGTRVPMIVVPALGTKEVFGPRGTQSWAPVELLDLMPTLFDLAELENSSRDWAAWEGISLLPVMRDPIEGFGKPAAVSQYYRGSGKRMYYGYTFRTTRYRFTAWCRARKWRKLSPASETSVPFSKCITEMYDYLGDRYETTNIFDSPSRSDVRNYFVQNLLGSLSGWHGPRLQAMGGMARPFDFNDRDLMSGMDEWVLP